MALAHERLGDGAQRGLRRRLRRQEHPRHRLQHRHRPALGCRRLHRGRGDGAHREPRGQPRHAAPQAAVLPRRQGRLPPAHRREQRRDARQPAVAHAARCRGVPRARAPRTRRGTRMFAVSGHVKKPGVYEVEFGVTTFRDLLYAPIYAGGIRGDRKLKAFIPGGASAPLFYEEHLDLPLEAGRGRQGRLHARLRCHRRDGRDHRHGQGHPQPGALLRPRVVRQVHAVPRGHHLARAHPRPHHRRPRPPRGHRPAARRLRQHQPRPALAAEADHHLPARPVRHPVDRGHHQAVPRGVRALRERALQHHGRHQRRGLPVAARRGRRPGGSAE